MLADTAADTGERALLENTFQRSGVIRLHQMVDETPNIDVKGAGPNTLRISTMQTAQGLFQRLVRREALVDLARAFHALLRVEQHFALAGCFWRSLWLICAGLCAI